MQSVMFWWVRSRTAKAQIKKQLSSVIHTARKVSDMFNFINVPFGYVMRFLSGVFGGNFALAVFMFTLFIDVLLIPLSIKSQKSSVQQMRIKPKMDEIRRKYGDDRQKLAEAQQKLYQDEGVSMSGGCLPMLVRLVIMMSIYSLILSPLTFMAGANNDQANNVYKALSTSMTELEKEDEARYNEISKEISWTKNSGKNTRGNQLLLINIIRENPDVFEEIMDEKEYKKIESDLQAIIKKDKETAIDYELFGINLLETPDFSFDFTKFRLIWLIPISAFLAQMLTSVISMQINKRNNPEAPSMAGMMLTMPLISLFIGFSLPGGVGFYWICSSLIGGVIQAAIQLLYGPQSMLARERAKEIVKQCEFEATQLKKYTAIDDTEE